MSSQRQLWSVAGYLGMVNENLFGLHPAAAGLRIAPYVTSGIRQDLFGGATSVALNRVSWHGKTVSVVLRFPAEVGTGAYTIGAITLNGAPTDGNVAESALGAQNLVEVQLAAPTEAPPALRTITDVTDYKVLYGPKTPAVSVSFSAGHVQVALDAAGENTGDVTFSIYRDGTRVADALAGSTTSWTDPSSSAGGASYCYTVETHYASGNVSQRANPACYWGESNARIMTLQASDFLAVGGSKTTANGRTYYEAWARRAIR